LVARQQLEKHKEFYPYAVSVDAAGEHRMVAADLKVDFPRSADLIAALVDSLATQRNSLRGVAIVADVKVSGNDAIRVTLEHVEGVALSVFVPYRHRRFGREPEYRDLQATDATPVIWP